MFFYLSPGGLPFQGSPYSLKIRVRPKFSAASTAGGLMDALARVAFLRGQSTATDQQEHPILELSDEELRLIVGGVDGAMGSSTATGSYNNSAPATCCDGTKVCCNPACPT